MLNGAYFSLNSYITLIKRKICVAIASIKTFVYLFRVTSSAKLNKARLRTNSSDNNEMLIFANLCNKACSF